MITANRRVPSAFTRSVLTLSTGTLASQLLLMAATPVLTRLYQPAAFGELAVFTSYATVLVGLFTAKYELSIILPKDDGTAIRLMKLTMFLAAACSLACFAIVLVLAGADLAVPPFFFLLPLLTLVAAFASVVQQWFSRKQQFRTSALSNVISTAVNVGASLAAAALPLAMPGKLVVGYCLGALAAATFFLVRFAGQYAEAWRANRGAYVALAVQYGYFPRYMVATSLLGVLSYQVVPELLRLAFSLDAAGHYAIAARFMFIPSILLGGAIGEVFRVELAKLHNERRDLRPVFRSVLKRMVWVGVPVFCGLLLLAPLAFRLVLGKSFSTSGRYAQLLSLGVFGQFLLQPFSAVFFVLREMRIYLAFQVALASVPFLAILAGKRLGSDVETSLLLLSVMTGVLAGLMLWQAYGVVARWSAEAA